MVRDQVNDLTFRMAQPAFLDQYPAATKNFVFSKRYEFDLLAARRYSDSSSEFEVSAPVANPASFLTPVNGNIVVNREGAFYLVSTNVCPYLSLTYSDGRNGQDSGYSTGPGGLFDTVFPNNGGALANPNMFGRDVRICGEIALYDKKRGTRMHDGKALPFQIFSGQNYCNKVLSSPTRYNVNTEIEPRLYLTEVRPGTILDAEADYNAAQFTAYLTVVFSGYKVLEV
jgi:hypothetical protein